MSLNERSALEMLFAEQARSSREPDVRDFKVQYQFHPTRKWLLDFAWPAKRIGLEVEGGIWIKGKHTTGTGIMRDIEKANALTMMGWKLIRAYANMVNDGRAIALVEELIARIIVVV